MHHTDTKQRELCLNARRIAAPVVLLVMLFALGSGSPAQAQEMSWLDVGEAAQQFSTQGARFGGGGGVYPYVLHNTGNLNALHDAYHTWIGIQGFEAPDGETYPYWINYFCQVDSECSGEQSFSRQFTTVSRFERPTVTVNGAASSRVPVNVDEIDPSMKADRKIVSRIATTSGITMRREIKQFSQQYHDNYHIVEYTFTNTGDVDGDGEREREQAIDSVYFYTDKRWGATVEAADVTAASAKWGKYMVHDKVRDGELRAQFSWLGHPGAATEVPWNPLGAPSVEGGGEEWPNRIDTTGRLVGWQFAGVNTLHADVSAADASDDPTQPSSMTWWFAEDPMFCNNECYDPTNVENNRKKFERLLRAGLAEPYFDEVLTGTTDSGDPDDPAQDFAHLKKGSTSVGDAVNDSSNAGYKVSGTYGPYALEPGESVSFVQAEVYSGIGKEAAYEIGHAYRERYEEGEGEAALPYDADEDGVIESDERKDKNEWVMAGRDSLLRDMRRAAANYEAGYDIPRAPRPPKTFHVDSSEKAIQLSWETYADAEDPAGYQIWRARKQYQGAKADQFEYERVGSVFGGARSYEDTDVEPGMDYYYYIQAVGGVNRDAAGETPTGERLKSNRYYTQTYDPVRVSGGESRFYVGPEGSDGNAGTSPESPFETFDAAVNRLGPGDTLVVLDGTYKGIEGEKRLHLSDKHGTEQNPIVIEAQHERRAWLKGDGYLPSLDIVESSYIVANGLRVSGDDNDDADVVNGSVVRVARSNHITLRRLLVHNNNRYTNSQGVLTILSQNVLIEESELYFFHRNGFQAFKSENVTVRRCYVNSHGHADIDGGRGSHKISQDGGDGSAPPYYSSHMTVENSISEDRNEGFDVGTSGFNTVTGGPSARDNKVLGSISLRDNRPGTIGQSRIKAEESQPAGNGLMENYLVINPIRRGMAARATKGTTVRNFTAIGVPGTVIKINGVHDELRSTIWPACTEIGGCEYDISNSLFVDNNRLINPLGKELNWTIDYSNFWKSSADGLGESITDNTGNVQNSMTEKPTKIGLGEGECAVFVPESSNMSGAGKDGEDIGANILYRYEDGELTGEPLWNPKTGAFPHGAVIEGSPNDPAKYDRVAANVHERLNVNTNGCTLPYSTVDVGDAEKSFDTTLKANYPNPFRGATTITYELRRPQAVTLTVYDVLGRKVATLVDGAQGAGEHRVRFDGRGRASGVYVYRLRAGGEPVGAGKMLLAQ